MSDTINQSNMLRVGTILHGTYRVDGYLASGGFGNTYVATNIQFGERYAIKEFFLKGVTERDENTTTISVSNQENVATFEAQRDKFKKEAVRLRKLSSPHIVCVHDLFEENGTAYYVMDFVDGENLRDYLKKVGHPLDEATVWQVFDQVLDALEVVHSHGLFHLDLKPANLMMDQQGGVKLIDFGASKQMKAGSGATTSTAVSYTNGYAPREQMEQALDKFGPWTDFYALGATLYFLLTDQKPPLPSDIDDDMTDDKHEALAMPDSISDRLRRMVLWLMATDRRKRPQSVAEIRRVLNLKAEEKPDDPAKGEEGENPAVNGKTEGTSSNSPSAASNDPPTTDNPSAADDETEIVQDDPTVEVEEKKSSKWRWVLVVLIFAVISVFGAKYFMSLGQDTAPATQEPDSTVVDSTVVEQQLTPAADQQQATATPAATGKTSAAPEAAATNATPKKKTPKHERPSQKKGSPADPKKDRKAEKTGSTLESSKGAKALPPLSMRQREAEDPIDAARERLKGAPQRDQKQKSKPAESTPV